MKSDREFVWIFNVNSRLTFTMTCRSRGWKNDCCPLPAFLLFPFRFHRQFRSFPKRLTYRETASIVAVSDFLELSVFNWFRSDQLLWSARGALLNLLLL